jgi:hypothetical protein
MAKTIYIETNGNVLGSGTFCTEYFFCSMASAYLPSMYYARLRVPMGTKPVSGFTAHVALIFCRNMQQYVCTYMRTRQLVRAAGTIPPSNGATFVFTAKYINWNLQEMSPDACFLIRLPDDSLFADIV